MHRDAVIVSDCLDEEGAEAEDEALDLPVDLYSKHTCHRELLVRSEIIKLQIQAVTF